MPPLLPLEAVIALVPVFGQYPYGLLYRDVTGTGKHVMTIVLGFSGYRNRVLEMRVTREFTELLVRVGGFFPFHAGMVRIPEEGHVLRFCAFDDRHNLLSPAKFAVRFHDDTDAGGTGIFAQFVESFADACKRDLLILTRNELVRKHADVGSVQLVSEV